MLPRILSWLSICCVCTLLYGHEIQQDSINYKLRKQIVIGGSIAGYTSLMTGLYALWYKDYPMGKFHFYNDNNQWNQMDKVGHTYSCYYEGVAGIEMMKWAGFSEKQSIYIGGLYGTFIQTGVEVLDGFSKGWGASYGDLLANTAGSVFAIGQELAWKEQRIWIKYSFTRTPYSRLRPNTLGSNFPERLLKDYNGQTYWLSGNVKSFFKEDSKWPSWLNIAVGYGANGMLGGVENSFTRDGITYNYTSIPRTRQFYLAPDIDLTRIPHKKGWQRATLIVLNSLKFPLPGLMFDTERGLQFQGISY